MMTIEAAAYLSSYVAHQAASDWVLGVPLIVWLPSTAGEREAYHSPLSSTIPHLMGVGGIVRVDPKGRLHIFTWAVDVH